MDVVAAAATVGLSGREGEVLRLSTQEMRNLLMEAAARQIDDAGIVGPLHLDQGFGGFRCHSEGRTSRP